MNIFEKMSAITSELNAVAKSRKVGEGRNSYKAVGEADVLAAVKPLEAKHGVYSYPFSREIVERDIITTRKEYKGDITESNRFFLRVQTVYRFVNTEKPDEYLDITTYGDGIDSGDKAPGKAMTYGDKYALLKAYKIITGDDPDQTASDPAGYSSSIKCEACGRKIEPYSDGHIIISAEDMARRSYEKYGHVYCVACAKKVR